jgi:ABC-2 type transport system permease protein
VVALLVRLKLTLLRNSLRRSVWRMVGLILGLVYALGLVVAAVAGLVGLRWASTELTGDLTVFAFSFLTVGWLTLSLLVFGMDETVDPSKFALLPVRARELMPGLLVAGLVGSPGIATVCVSLGLVVTWSRNVPLTLAALVALVAGTATCFLLARASTTAFASFLSSRRFREVALVLLVLVGAGIGVGANLIGGLAGTSAGTLAGDPRRLLSGAATVLGWTPFGWAWAVPAEVAAGRWVSAVVHLVLAVALVAGLWVAWGHFLAQRLVEPVDTGGPGTRITPGGLVERLYPATPAGAVAERTLRYWRRDPRYLAGVAGLLVAPVVLLVTQATNDDVTPALAAFVPVLLAALVGVSLAADLSYDGSAVWLHVSCGLSGAADRRGRVLSTLTVFTPVLVLMFVIAMLLSGSWNLLVPVLALTIALTLVGLGAGCFVGALWQWPAPPPGANPFQRGSSGGLPALLSFTVTGVATLVLSLPTLALVIGSYWVGWLAYAALPVGVLSGWLVLRTGIRAGGAVLDRRWPEVMTSLSDRAG